MKKSNPYFLIQTISLFGLVVLICTASGCRTELTFRQAQTNELRFSSDTVYLDTLFTGLSSATYPLKVYNISEDPISIPNISLGQGESSSFRLNVDGMSGKSFDNVALLPKDSMYVFIETTADINKRANSNTTFLYEDVLQFANSGSVTLMTLVKDAVFLYPKKDSQGIKESIPIGVDNDGNEIMLEGFYLDDDALVFTNEKPYVVYGYIGVQSGKTAVFEAGARVHFHENSGIFVAENATLLVNGEPSDDPEKMEREVIFEGDRLEYLYDDIPGQWGAIWLTSGSRQHQINHATIKNATVGILMDDNDGITNPTLTLKNVQIHNSAAVNLWGKTAHIYAENSVFGDAGQASFYGNIGGNYQFTHCTFANYWSKSFRNTPTVLLNDYADLSDGTNITKSLEKATFDNCIIDGSQLNEFFVEQLGTGSFEFKLNHTALRFQSIRDSDNENPFFDWNNANHYNNIIRNGESSFVENSENDFRITQESDYIKKGDATVVSQVPVDLLGKERTVPPDLGAYQHVIVDD